ncbi:MAG: GNAT family N-acetyltransferase [Deinococcota bacterium]
MVQAALDDTRAQGCRVVPACPFVAAFIQKHPGYADLVA